MTFFNAQLSFLEGENLKRSNFTVGRCKAEQYRVFNATVGGFQWRIPSNGLLFSDASHILIFVTQQLILSFSNNHLLVGVQRRKMSMTSKLVALAALAGSAAAFSPMMMVRNPRHLSHFHSLRKVRKG
jgi:hypothetical protein